MAILTPKEARKELRRAHSDGRLIPFLGAGFSAPLRLPGWSDLMSWMARPLKFDPALFALQGLPPQLAGYYAVEQGGLDPFIQEMRDRFHAPEVVERRRTSIQHKALVELGARR